VPIVRKSNASRHMQRLEERIDKLKEVLKGSSPNSNLWNFYSLNESDFARDFTEIDPSELSIALGDIENAIKELKKAKTLKADRLQQ
jgi:tetratricopeptide (TPR) repeat protein